MYTNNTQADHGYSRQRFVSMPDGLNSMIGYYILSYIASYISSN